MKRPWLIRSLALALAASWLAAPTWAHSAPPKIDARHLIVPGVGIGPVKLGASEIDVEAILGVPDETIPIDSERHILQWAEKSLLVGIEGKRVVLVSTHSNLYALGSGLKVGDPGARAKKLFPNLTVPDVRGVFGWAGDAYGVNFLNHPTDGDGEPLLSYGLPPEWTIDEINVIAPVVATESASP
jgi:hypothetical protein